MTDARRLKRMPWALLVLGGLCSGLPAQSLNGDWAAQLQLKEAAVPFRLTLGGTDQKPIVSFWNGDQQVSSSQATRQGQNLNAWFDFLGTEMHVRVIDGGLVGDYGNPKKGLDQFTAHRETKTHEQASTAVPSIAGEWQIPVKSPKGELAWRFLVQQTGPETKAAILRVDGDTGALTGRFSEGKFILSHFSGARAALLVIEPDADLKELRLRWTDKKGTQTYTAVRREVALQQKLPAPTDPAEHTTVEDPAAPFRFSAPDLAGHLVSNTDPRFRDKVVVLNVMGSWCPNCHDEAPFLESLSTQYRSRGLEVVSLDFEEVAQLEQPERLKAFIHRYGIDYTVLLAGTPEDLKQRLPQAVHLDSWPTTFFLGRDGRVKAIHAGFAAKASGQIHERTEAEIRGTVEHLLNGHPLSASR